MISAAWPPDLESTTNAQASRPTLDGAFPDAPLRGSPPAPSAHGGAVSCSVLVSSLAFGRMYISSTDRPSLSAEMPLLFLAPLTFSDFSHQSTIAVLICVGSFASRSQARRRPIAMSYAFSLVPTISITRRRHEKLVKDGLTDPDIRELPSVSVVVVPYVAEFSLVGLFQIGSRAARDVNGRSRNGWHILSINDRDAHLPSRILVDMDDDVRTVHPRGLAIAAAHGSRLLFKSSAR